MRRVAAVTGALLLTVAMPAFAHRLDEYLQATTIAVGKDRVAIELRLAPGVAVLGGVLAEVDTDADGVITDAERGAYAHHVLRDVSLAIDGTPLPLRVVSTSAASVADLREGLGEIRLAFETDLPPGAGVRTLRFENHHLPRISAYLVNGLVPRDPELRITSQSRDSLQSTLDLTYTQENAATVSVSFDTLLAWLLLGGAGITLVLRLGSVAWAQRARGLTKS
jgi:hypothetical protein